MKRFINIFIYKYVDKKVDGVRSVWLNVTVAQGFVCFIID